MLLLVSNSRAIWTTGWEAAGSLGAATSVVGVAGRGAEIKVAQQSAAMKVQEVFMTPLF
jgi:hypothetical protein